MWLFWSPEPTTSWSRTSWKAWFICVETGIKCERDCFANCSRYWRLIHWGDFFKVLSLIRFFFYQLWIVTRQEIQDKEISSGHFCIRTKQNHDQQFLKVQKNPKLAKEIQFENCLSLWFSTWHPPWSTWRHSCFWVRHLHPGFNKKEVSNPWDAQ